jgi:hypothetical protein
MDSIITESLFKNILTSTCLTEDNHHLCYQTNDTNQVETIYNTMTGHPEIRFLVSFYTVLFFFA